MLDITDRLVVIVGGGLVAARKASGLLAAGARRVTCVALEFSPEMPPEVQRVTAPFDAAHLDGAGLVFAATDSPQVNEAVVKESRRRGMMVNRADVDDEHPSDFSTPALWRNGALCLMVSAGGSPALAARVRDDLAAKVDPLHVTMAAAMQVLRPLIREARGLGPTRRREALRDLAGDEAMASLRAGGIAALRQWLHKRYPEL